MRHISIADNDMMKRRQRYDQKYCFVDAHQGIIGLTTVPRRIDRFEKTKNVSRFWKNHFSKFINENESENMLFHLRTQFHKLDNYVR